MLWSEKTTVCRIFSCQIASLDGGQTPMPPGSLTRGAPKPRSVSSPGIIFATKRRDKNLFTSASGRARHSNGFSATHAALGANLMSATTGYGADVGDAKTQEPHAVHRNFFQISRRLVMTLPICGWSASTNPKLFARLAKAAFGLQRGEGWWRIPGSNR